MIRRKLRTLEAMLLLTLAWAAIRIVPVRHLLPKKKGSDPFIPKTQPDPISPSALAVRGAIRSATARLPFKPTCLAQALAASAMLERRGLPHHLHIGARQGAEFEAHAWVESAGLVVAGEGDVGSYSVMLSRKR